MNGPVDPKKAPAPQTQRVTTVSKAIPMAPPAPKPAPKPQQRKLLGKILEEMGVANPVQVKAAIKRQMEDSGKRIGDILLEMGIGTPAQITEALARQFGFPYVDLTALKINPEITKLIKREICEERTLFPIMANGKKLTVAISDPLDFVALEDLKFILNTEIDFALSPKPDIQATIQKYYGTKDASALHETIDLATAAQDVKLRGGEIDLTGVDPDKDDAPVIKFVQLMIAEAIKNRASDIHVEPMEDRVRIRYRVDGQCAEVNAPPKRLQGAVLSRIKIMAEMDIAEKRKPQDGRIKINAGGRELDIRVSSLPATHGESIVMRLLDKKAGLVGMEELGFFTTDYKRFKGIIKRPNGIVLVTGPTGSGKTTTLYAALKELNRPDVKIITAENPVEYNIAGINQAQVKANIGMTFQRILRAMLRQAPNIILVGEIRDRETAEIAIQAALTGHLVFSTLHTNDAPGALTRLVDMGVKPFLVASSIQAIMAQRLVRILCPKCKAPNPDPDPGVLAALGIKPEDTKGRNISRAVGCDACNKSGFRGRKGIFELMELNSTIRELVFHKQPTARIQEQARNNGMVTLLEDGVRKIFDGITTLEEVLTLTHREDIAY
ncbi:MAG TPA: ATPase, T2SS/T4P/T4SS family [Planctomycetota bacterium]|nr:ATPase, T2SS/T4P/T4SS family [Planctomycetota bacterium]